MTNQLNDQNLIDRSKIIKKNVKSKQKTTYFSKTHFFVKE